MKKKTIVIILSVFVCIFLISSTYSILKKGADSSKNIATATWSVELVQDGVNDELSIMPGYTTADYLLKVKSTSEVNVKYDIIISDLPSGVEVDIDHANDYQTQDDNHTITVPNAGTILYTASNKTNTHTLTFRGASNAQVINNQTVTIDVVVTQQ